MYVDYIVLRTKMKGLIYPILFSKEIFKSISNAKHIYEIWIYLLDITKFLSPRGL